MLDKVAVVQIIGVVSVLIGLVPVGMWLRSLRGSRRFHVSQGGWGFAFVFLLAGILFLWLGPDFVRPE